jgi:ribonuclease D
MQLDDFPDPIFIARPPALKRLVEELSSEPIIAVDTEANGLYAYREQVCLIQFSTPSNDYLVDVLALEDVSSLGSIFSSPEIEKVFHAAEYDIIMLSQDFDFSFANIFDTMIAARILGWQAVGLASILETEFNIKVNKKFQRANWARRPLPQEMLTYARLDTHFLIPLRDQMKLALKTNGRWELAQEDFRRGCRVDASNHRNNLGDCWRVNGAYDLTSQQAAVLKELCKFRDKKACSTDRPLFKVISDKALIQIAKSCPHSVKELKQVQGVSHRQARWLGDGLISSVQRGLAADPIYPPRKPRPSKAYINRYERLRDWRKKKARNLGVKSDVILPKDLLHTLAKQAPTSPAELAQVLDSVPWRLEKFGNEILDLLKKE